MFEQVLVGMLGMDDSDEDRASKLERAFNKLHDLTDGVRTSLLKNRVFESLNAEIDDADVDALDAQITARDKQRETAATGSASVRTSATHQLDLGDMHAGKASSKVVRKNH